MKDLIDQYLGALGALPEEHRASFVHETRVRAFRRALELEDAGAAPAKQKRVPGKG